MIDLTKHIDFFDPMKLEKRIHIIGVGALGSNIAIQLAKLGIKKIDIWDFDTVDSHNITNQAFNETDIGLFKVDALEIHLKEQNEDIEIIKHNKPYTDELLSGFVFMCVDSIETRYKIGLDNQYNNQIKLLIDTRIGLTNGQVFIIDWSIPKKIENYLKLSDFKDNEANTIKSACGTELSVSPTVLCTTAYAISSLINYINGVPIKQQIIFDSFTYKTNAM